MDAMWHPLSDAAATKLACATPHGWGYHASTGHRHHNRPQAQGPRIVQEPAQEGDTIGLLLDCSRGSLSAFNDGTKLGDVVSPPDASDDTMDFMKARGLEGWHGHFTRFLDVQAPRDVKAVTADDMHRCAAEPSHAIG